MEKYVYVFMISNIQVAGSSPVLALNLQFANHKYTWKTIHWIESLVQLFIGAISVAHQRENNSRQLYKYVFYLYSYRLLKSDSKTHNYQLFIYLLKFKNLSKWKNQSF